MKPLNVLIAELRSIDQSSPTYAADFERILTEIMALKSAEVIVPLLSCLDDRAPYDEVMFSIIHGIETYEDKVYVAHLLQRSEDLCGKAPRWASILFMRVLNAESSRHELVRQLRDKEQGIKLTIKALMEKINARGVQFLAKTAPVIAAASEK